MKRLSERYRNAHLVVRLSLPVAATLLVMLLVCQAMLYALAADTINKQLADAAESSATRAGSYMDTRLSSIIERFMYIRLDDAVEENLAGYLLSDDSDSAAVTMGRVSRTLSLNKATEPLLSSLLLYTPKQAFTADGMPMANGYTFEGSGLWPLLQDQSSSVLFAPAQRDEIFISHRQVVPILHRFGIDGYPYSCVLIANLDQEKLTSYIMEILPEDGSEILLVDDSGNLITQPYRTASEDLAADPALIQQILESDGCMDVKLAEGSYLALSGNLNTAPWHVIYLQSKQHVFNQLGQLRTIYTTVTLVVLMLLILVLHNITETVTQPLRNLCEHIRAADGHDKLTEFEYPYHDEIGTLTRTYNSMLHRIEHLLQEQNSYIQQLKDEKARADVEQELKRRAELRALQAQINPHFLYNTLDSIRWKAERADAGDIVQMTTALATLFRIGLSRGREIITIDEETRHVESYLMIQKQRYKDRLSYEMDIEPDLMELYTVKLILQPLVENAIYHGIKESDHSGEVTITGRREGDVLLLRVADNGMGIPPERLAILQENLARGYSVPREGYGIYNVNERIRLHFGPEYGLTLESEWGRGTISQVRLPCITREDVERYVSHSDCG